MLQSISENCVEGDASRTSTKVLSVKLPIFSNLEELAPRAELPGAKRTRKSVAERGKFGGADGIRTHDLLDAIEARSQLRHGPTV